MENIMKKFKNKSAFTLIEMLIVLFIIAILLILIIPNITKNIDTAKDNKTVITSNVTSKEATIAFALLCFFLVLINLIPLLGSVYWFNFFYFFIFIILILFFFPCFLFFFFFFFGFFFLSFFIFQF